MSKPWTAAQLVPRPEKLKNNFFQKLKNYEIDLFLKICRFETLNKVLAWDKFTKLWENVEF